MTKISMYNSFDDFVYTPETLMGDAAEAITNGFVKAFGYESKDDFIRLMCHPHVDRI
jgi:hypothetical protein